MIINAKHRNKGKLFLSEIPYLKKKLIIFLRVF